MNNIEDIKELLKEVDSISRKYAEFDEISGDNYNIFKELKLTNAEWAHSRVLATLLDPEGSHGKGNLFLKKFLEIVEKKHKTWAETDEDKGEVMEKFSIECARVQEEKTIEDGRPDIAITNENDDKIILENKIWSKERDKQLERYSNEKPIHLIYLTPFGIKAEEIGEGKFNYIKMSYKDDIQEWLELCKKESVNNPTLRETLTQYILLIRQLTGQTRRIKMSEEIVKVLAKDAENIEAAFEIGENLRSLKLQKHLIYENLFKPLTEWAAKEHNDLHLEIKTEIETENVWRKWFKIITVEKKEWHDQNFRICFEFGGNIGTFQNLYYGLTFTKDWPINKNPEIVEKLRHSSTPPTPEWYQQYQFEEYNNWNRDVFAKLSEPDNDIVKSFKDKINELLDILKEKNLI